MGSRKKVSKVKKVKTTKNLEAVGKKKGSNLRQTRLQVHQNELAKVPNARLRDLQRRKQELLKLEAGLEENNAFLSRRISRFANPDRWELKERQEYTEKLQPLVNQWEALFGFDFSSLKNALRADVEEMEHVDTWGVKFSYGAESYSLKFVARRKDASFEIMDISIKLAHPKVENLELRNLLDECARGGRLADIFHVIRKYDTLHLTRKQTVDELTEKWEDSNVFHSAFNEQTGALEVFIGPKENFLFKVTVQIEGSITSGERLTQMSSIEYGTGGVRRCQSAGFTETLVMQKLQTDLFGLLKDLLKVAELTD